MPVSDLDRDAIRERAERVKQVAVGASWVLANKDVPALLDENERLEAENKQLRDETRQFAEIWNQWRDARMEANARDALDSS